MIMAGLVVSVIGMMMETLGPTYVSDVLGADPAFTVYVFAPAGSARWSPLAARRG